MKVNRAMKRWNSQVFFLVVISALILGAGTVYSAPQDNLVQKQQQILQQKEQEQASKRAEKELQYRVGQSMTKRLVESKAFKEAEISSWRILKPKKYFEEITIKRMKKK